MNDLLWKLHRLRAMSPPEIAHRVVEKVRKSTARGTLEGWERYANPGPVPVLPGPWESLARAVPEHELNARTTVLLAGEFTALGQTWPPRTPECLFPAELWLARYPSRFSSANNHRRPWPCRCVGDPCAR
ncbi:hypothetical protein [Halochromatium sp.]